jgi:voltage-gated potassium channel
VIYGTLGYALLERWTILDAIYMTVITITTVGFEEVHPLSNVGKVFTISLLAAGVGMVLYALGLFTESLAAGEFLEYRRSRRMHNRLASLHDHFIICGYERAGMYAVRELERENVQWVVIDRNVETIEQLQREDRLAISGDAASEDLLRLAGIERARGLISTIDSDEGAVCVSLAARALNPKLYILARAARSESIRHLELAGANRVVSPYEMAGRHMADLALRPDVLDIMDPHRHGRSEVSVEELLILPSSRANGRTLTDAGLLNGNGARILAVRRTDGSLTVGAEPTLTLNEGDLVVSLGTMHELAATAQSLL